MKKVSLIKSNTLYYEVLTPSSKYLEVNTLIKEMIKQIKL